MSETVTIFEVLITKPGCGNPAYWYKNEVGKTFFCNKDDFPNLGNGFPTINFSLHPDMNGKKYSGHSNSIRPQDCTVIRQFELIPKPTKPQS